MFTSPQVMVDIDLPEMVYRTVRWSIGSVQRRGRDCRNFSGIHRSTPHRGPEVENCCHRKESPLIFGRARKIAHGPIGICIFKIRRLDVRNSLDARLLNAASYAA